MELKYSLTYLLVEPLLEESLLVFILKLQRRLKTSELCALERRELECLESLFITKDLISIESLLILWLKEVILQREMELEVNPFMEPSLLMRTLRSSITREVSFQWQTLAKIQMEVNSS